MIWLKASPGFDDLVRSGFDDIGKSDFGASEWPMRVFYKQAF